MENLAGNKECDEVIAQELHRCGINIVPCERVNTEVPFSLMGELNGFTFKRAWYYWCVYGRVPLSLANILYAHPVGKADIRAGGDCACRPPDTWATRWLDGKQVITEKERVSFAQFKDSECETLRNIYQESLVKYLSFPGDNYPEGVKSFVDVYHIDSELGLYIFAETIRGEIP